MKQNMDILLVESICIADFHVINYKSDMFAPKMRLVLFSAIKNKDRKRIGMIHKEFKSMLRDIDINGKSNLIHFRKQWDHAIENSKGKMTKTTKPNSFNEYVSKVLQLNEVFYSDNIEEFDALVNLLTEINLHNLEGVYQYLTK